MNGFQCIWTVPTKCGMTHRPAFLAYDHSILTIVLSAMLWRKYMGQLVLYADVAAAQSLEKLGFIDLWDNVNTSLLSQSRLKKVNPAVFWSAGKILAYTNEETPCAFVDCDMLIWRNLEPQLSLDLHFAHWEQAGDSRFYPGRKGLSVPQGYTFNKKWRWNRVMAINTSLLYFGNSVLKERYVEEAFRFMTQNPKRMSTSDAPEMLFVDQWLPSLCADSMNMCISPIIDWVWRPDYGWRTHDKKHWDHRSRLYHLDSRRPFTHVWLHKFHLMECLSARRRYCNALAGKILQLFPKQAERLARLPMTTSIIKRAMLSK